MFETTLLVIYLLAALGVIGLVLIQQGKGADMGASFGAGASNTVFGAGGSGNFLTRMTAFFAFIFIVVCLILGRMSTHKADSQWVAPAEGQTIQKTDDVVKEVPTQKGEEIPE
ncbi:MULTISPECIES: preprotein translocase subunit SecG [Vibrio]|uniref:Protein-export membrane protein SecG n=1 Tax=Vibrio halioticoli NBRC 102217 TaxID=1219072 RepID=V5FFC2_9VIBR|nr:MULTISPECIES: preprotein translocase subunit SecG [Vibrio]MPW37767.1 preprotein translocase subunit SecG [Vibrio sp. B1Z05]GAD90413.1 preprotein translocase subunit SecG [Vibrio halioticoli NBRC 102217]